MYLSLQPASYGKKNGMWYASPGNQGWGSKPISRKPSIMEADLGTLSTTSGSIKRSAGRVIRIINHLDHSVQVSYYIIDIYYMHNILWTTSKFLLHFYSFSNNMKWTQKQTSSYTKMTLNNSFRCSFSYVYINIYISWFD